MKVCVTMHEVRNGLGDILSLHDARRDLKTPRRIQLTLDLVNLLDGQAAEIARFGDADGSLVRAVRSAAVREQPSERNADRQPCQPTGRKRTAILTADYRRGVCL
jgi:hypothetical protein